MGTLVNTSSVNLVGTAAGVRAGWVKRRALRGGLLNKSKTLRRKVYRKRAAMK